MQINFGVRGLLSFGGLSFFPNLAKFPFRTMDYSPWGSKKNRLKKFMKVEVNVKCIQTNFGRHGFSGFRDFAPQIWPKFHFGQWTTVLGSKKIIGHHNYLIFLEFYFCDIIQSILRNNYCCPNIFMIL